MKDPKKFDPENITVAGFSSALVGCVLFLDTPHKELIASALPIAVGLLYKGIYWLFVKCDIQTVAEMKVINAANKQIKTASEALADPNLDEASKTKFKKILDESYEAKIKATTMDVQKVKL